jgi:hypothetical protein
VEFTVDAPGKASDVLTRARAVMSAVVDNGEAQPSLDEWKQMLPAWFVAACAPERTKEQAAAWLVWWRTLSRADQVAAEEKLGWSLSDWLYWLEPDQRDWYWWDGSQLSDDTAKVTVEVVDFNAPLGSFRWLLTAVGAIEVRDSRA